jgi:dethiobiotin synthetase
MGEENRDSERVIVEMGRAQRLGRLPHLAPLTADALRTAFARHFNRDDFLEMSAR